MEQINEEIWKDIPEYEGLYQISNVGRVKSLSRSVRCTGDSFRRVRDRFLRSANGTVGYPYVTLIKNGIKKSKRIHRMLAIAFIPNPENKPQVNHKNGIKDDFRLSNLEWVTTSENQKHSYDSDLRKPIQGESHGHAILGEKEVIEIRNSNVRPYILCKQYNISETTIRDIRKRRSWRHL